MSCIEITGTEGTIPEIPENEFACIVSFISGSKYIIHIKENESEVSTICDIILESIVGPSEIRFDAKLVRKENDEMNVLKYNTTLIRQNPLEEFNVIISDISFIDEFEEKLTCEWCSYDEQFEWFSDYRNNEFLKIIIDPEELEYIDEDCKLCLADLLEKVLEMDAINLNSISFEVHPLVLEKKIFDCLSNNKTITELSLSLFISDNMEEIYDLIETNMTIQCYSFTNIEFDYHKLFNSISKNNSFVYLYINNTNQTKTLSKIIEESPSLYTINRIFDTTRDLVNNLEKGQFCLVETDGATSGLKRFIVNRLLTD